MAYVHCLCFIFLFASATGMQQPAESKRRAGWQASVRASLSERNYSGAARELQKVLSDQEKNPAFLNLLATTLERAGKHQEATAYYQRALSYLPQSSTIRLNLALNYVRLGQMSEASAEFTRLLKEAPLRPPRAAAYQQSEGDEAIQSFVSYVPARERDWHELAMLFLRHGRTQGAQSILEAATKMFPHSAQLHYDLGWARQEGSRFEAAEQAFARALVLQPVFPEATVRLGYAQYIQGKYAEAIRVYRKLLDTNHDSYEVHFFLAQALTKTGPSGLEVAVRHLQKAIALNPASSDSRLELARIYLKTGDLAAARRELEVVDRISPEQEKTYYLMSQVYAAMGEITQAQKAMRAFGESRRRERERARREMEYDLLGDPTLTGGDAAGKALEFIEAYKAELLAGDYDWIWRRLTPPSKEFYDNDPKRFFSIAARVFGNPDTKELIRQSKLEGGKRIAGRIVCEFVAQNGLRLPPLVLAEGETDLKIDYAFEWTTAGLGYLGAR